MAEQIIGHYRILDIIGKGGMGIVYRAEDINLGRIVALKILGDEAADNIRRFYREAQAAASSDHPNIVTIYEVGKQDNIHFIAMEYIDGVSLRVIVDNGAPLPVNQVIDIVIQLCDALSNAHQRGVVHRDIKSTNIMITDNGRVKITDFGLARLAGASNLTETGSIMGSIPYMSPEQAVGDVVDKRSDIYSTGVVLYELLVGRTPFAKNNIVSVLYAHLNEEPRRLRDIRPDIPVELERIVMKMIKKKLEERYQDMPDVLQDLRDFKAHLKGEAVLKFDKSSFISKSSGDRKDRTHPSIGRYLKGNLRDKEGDSRRGEVISEDISSVEFDARELLKKVEIDSSKYESESSEELNDEITDLEGYKFEDLLELLKDEDSLTRLLAVDALGKSGNERAVEPLIDLMLRDKDHFVRNVASEALGSLKSERAVDILLDKLGSDDPTVRRNIILTLGRLGGKQVSKALEQVALSDGNSEVRGHAVDSLGLLKDEAGSEILVKVVLTDEDIAVSERAINVLKDVNSPEMITALIQGLSHRKTFVRSRAARALGRIGDKRAIKPLLRLLSTSDVVLRRAVIEALGRIGDKEALPYLQRLLKDPDVYNIASKTIQRIRETTSGLSD